jgi:hypothetical protein
VLTTRRISLAATLMTLLLACGASTAFGRQDLRMPDTRDAAVAATQKQDLRMPDTRDAGRADQIAGQMKRFHAANPAVHSPEDVRNIDAGRKYAPSTTPEEISAPKPISTTTSASVVAVAGAALVCCVILLSAAALVVKRRRARRHQPVAAS